jgi:hypothetical protein
MDASITSGKEHSAVENPETSPPRDVKILGSFHEQILAVNHLAK